MRPLIIAIDGPSGVGKGTVAREVARILGYRHVDTGAMYRAVAWQARHLGLDLGDEQAVASATASLTFQLTADAVTIDGTDVTLALRTPEIDRGATLVARLAAVRAILVARQREIGRDGGVVMEGRDIGTVVFPDADVKIYLDAAKEERARRRAADPARARPGDVHVADVARELDARDRSDRTRAASPLAAAEDAHILDTTGLAIDEVVAKVMEIVNSVWAERGRCPNGRT
jgi:CMP/dCMP kinase